MGGVTGELSIAPLFWWRASPPDRDGIVDVCSIGIIDVFQRYTTERHCVYTYKKCVRFDNPSVCPPSDYGDRFKAFMSELVMSPSPKWDWLECRMEINEDEDRIVCGVSSDPGFSG